MLKFFCVFIFIVINVTNCQSQIDYDTYIKVNEKNIIPPKYIYGYSAVADSLFNLVASYKIPPDSIFTYAADFVLKFDKNGKIVDQNYDIYLNYMSDVFKKLPNALSGWVRKIDHWIPAYNKKTKKPIPNFKLYFSISLNHSIWITINDHRSGSLFDLFKKEYPISYVP